MKAFLGKGKKIPEPFPEPFTTALNRYRFFGGARPALKSKNLNRKAKLLGFPTSHNGASGRGEERSSGFRVKKARS
jgi:hypothetical protein